MWTIVPNQFACFYCTTLVFLAVHRADLFRHLPLTTIINTENILKIYITGQRFSFLKTKLSLSTFP
jgi:hypothetical protein